MTNLPVVLVTKENVNQFSKNDEARKYILGKLEAGQIIIASNCTLGEYVCSCTIGKYSIFQSIDKATRDRVFPEWTAEEILKREG